MHGMAIVARVQGAHAQLSHISACCDEKHHGTIVTCGLDANQYHASSSTIIHGKLDFDTPLDPSHHLSQGQDLAIDHQK